MSSKAKGTMDAEEYRQGIRNHFMDCFKSQPNQKKIRECFQDQPLKNEQAPCNGKENGSNEKQRHFNQAPTSGGDADRMFYYSKYNSHRGGGDSSRIYDTNESISVKQLQTSYKPSISSLTSKTKKPSHKYQTTPLVVDDIIGDHSYMYEIDSNLGGIGNGSEDNSAKSEKSFKTIVSRRSAQDLRRLVTSQCKLHDAIGETIKEMCKTGVENTVENNACSFPDERSTKYPLTLSQCKRCTDHIHSVPSLKDVTTEIEKGDLLDSRNTNTLTLSVDDVISSRVISPMIHKLHRMYLNNLKEEISLIEDLERLPNKVSEVYKSIIFKQKDK